MKATLKPYRILNFLFSVWGLWTCPKRKSHLPQHCNMRSHSESFDSASFQDENGSDGQSDKTVPPTQHWRLWPMTQCDGDDDDMDERRAVYEDIKGGACLYRRTCPSVNGTKN